jgi:hypothetical protein
MAGLQSEAASRRWAAKPERGKKSANGVAGGRSKRSRTSLRHASSSPKVESARNKWRGVWRRPGSTSVAGENCVRGVFTWNMDVNCALSPLGSTLSKSAGLHRTIRAISLVSDSSPGGPMRQQTKPFIIERKPSRKSKPDVGKPSIWGELDLTLHQDQQIDHDVVEVAAGGADDDCR